MDFSCRIHREQVYLFYCTDHDVPCCSECKRVSHKPTCNMEVMDPYTNEKDIGIKMADILKRMNKTNTLLDELYKEFYKSRKHLLKQKDKFEKDLQQFRKQIDAYIDEAENKIREHFHDLYNQETEVLKQREVGVMSKKNSLHEWVNNVEEMARKELSLQSYVYMSKINNSFSVIEKHASKIERKFENVTLTFTISNDFQEFLKGLKLAYTQVKRTATAHDPEPSTAFPKTAKTNHVQEKDRSLQKVGEFRISNDTDFQSSSDIKLLHNGDIVVTNLNNRKLVVYDQNGLGKLEMELSHNPLCLATMPDDLVAMTLANERKVVILDLKTRMVHRQIKLEDECHGIAQTGHRLILNGKVKGLFVLNSDFEVENMIPDITGKLILCGRSDGTIIGGTLHCNNIYCIDIRGVKLFEISPPGLEYLNGISVSNDGDIYITGFLSNTLHRIDSDGENSCVVLNKDDGINLPRSICSCYSTKSIMVVNNDGRLIVTYNLK
ncbi:Hypothetical predicted protein [Mytilus galloprovincialis]|uniref:B box-type domain-containing protein n=2 Tax=Mytilus galloprovincialis TaxID=29158 RepID=A0A8B6EZ11_MYTGA|nr:Hypothetical predicted protein [Mytilus galloprovincialis]